MDNTREQIIASLETYHDALFTPGVYQHSIFGQAALLLKKDAVEVVHGRWVHPEGYVVSNGFLCSVCNHAETSYRPIHPLGGGYFRADENGNFYYPPNMNYCPNCGAKMDGDGNGSA